MSEQAAEAKPTQYHKVFSPKTNRFLCEYDPTRQVMLFPEDGGMTPVDLVLYHSEEFADQRPQRKPKHKRRTHPSNGGESNVNSEVQENEGGP